MKLELPFNILRQWRIQEFSGLIFILVFLSLLFSPKMFPYSPFFSLKPFSAISEHKEQGREYEQGRCREGHGHMCMCIFSPLARGTGSKRKKRKMSVKMTHCQQEKTDGKKERFAHSLHPLPLSSCPAYPIVSMCTSASVYYSQPHSIPH